MNAAAMSLQEILSEDKSILEKNVEFCLAICTAFLDWQRKELIEKEPSPADLAKHRTNLKWLIRMTRWLQSAVSDPDYPARQYLAEIQGRILQLEKSWEMFYENPMTDAEADALLQKAFPDAPGTGNAA